MLKFAERIIQTNRQIDKKTKLRCALYPHSSSKGFYAVL